MTANFKRFLLRIPRSKARLIESYSKTFKISQNQIILNAITEYFEKRITEMKVK